MEIEVRKPKTLNLTPETQNVEPWTLKSKPHTIYPISLKKSIPILISLPMIIWSFIFLGTGCTKYFPPFFLSLYLELRHSCLEPQELSPTVRCSPIKVRLVPGLHLLFEWRQVSWYQQHEISFFRSFFLCVCPEAVIQWLRIARIVCVSLCVAALFYESDTGESWARIFVNGHLRYIHPRFWVVDCNPLSSFGALCWILPSHIIVRWLCILGLSSLDNQETLTFLSSSLLCKNHTRDMVA